VVGQLAQSDVQTVQRTLEIDCPVFALICDLEQKPGFRAFIEQVSSAERLWPMGQRFPLVPDVDPHEIQGVIETGVAALNRRLVADMILSRFDTDVGKEQMGRVSRSVRANMHLYQFMSHLKTSCHHLANFLYQSTQTEPGGNVLLAGCYFVATGKDARFEQAFVGDVFVELLNSQNFVAWSARALAWEAGYRRLARLGYVGLASVLVLLGTLGYGAVFGR
jgi:type VI protein secretion system component VasK